MVGVAVKVNELPAQLGLVPLVNAILTDGVTVAVLFIVIPALVAVAGLGQVALLVIITSTDCPFVTALVVKVADALLCIELPAILKL